MPEKILFTRRGFISRGAQLLAVASAIPMFVDRSARCLAAEAAANPQGVGRPDRVLVVVQLQGGNDGLNMLVPTTNDDYYRARPTIAIAKKEALKLTDDFGLNPAADGLKKMYDAGTLAFVHAVGYPNSNRSHFRGTDIWTSAEPDSKGQTGWLGRCCEALSGPANDAKRKPLEPATAIALDLEPPRAIKGHAYVPVTFRAPNELSYRSGRDAKTQAAFGKLNAGNPSSPGNGAMDAMNDDDHRPAIPMGTHGSLAQDDDTAHFLQQSALNARLCAARIQASTSNVQNIATYPATRFAGDLKLVAQMIGSDLPTRIYYVKLNGFDTHGKQPERHTKLLGELGGGLNAFMDDLKAMGHLDRVTVMTFSEFGRRVAENGAAGTDHGAAAPLLIAGGKINAGLHGTFPSLEPGKLNRGDVPHTTDFRSVYATVLHDWMRADADAVLGKPFKTLPLYKGA